MKEERRIKDRRVNNVKKWFVIILAINTSRKNVFLHSNDNFNFSFSDNTGVTVFMKN